MERSEIRFPIEARISRFSRIFALLVVAPLLTLLSVYVLVACMVSRAEMMSIVITSAVAIAILGVALASPIVVHRYRLRITNTNVEQQYWKEIKLEYQDVERAEVGLRTMVLIGHDRKIQLPGELENRDYLFSIIAKKLSEAGKIQVSGDKRRIAKIFGKVQR